MYRFSETHIVRELEELEEFSTSDVNRFSKDLPGLEATNNAEDEDGQFPSGFRYIMGKLRVL